MKKTIIFLAAFLLVGACATKVIDIKSPCVSSDDGPCGPKKPINDWWIKNTKTKQQQNS